MISRRYINQIIRKLKCCYVYPYHSKFIIFIQLTNKKNIRAFIIYRKKDRYLVDILFNNFTRENLF